MCNAFQHPSDCSCGFGPPYDDVQVEIRKLPDPKERNPSQIGDLALRFPLPRANYFSEINSAEKIEVMATLTSALQGLANDRFGEGNIRVKVNEIQKGSITFGVLLAMGAVGAYKFFKDYDALSKGVKTFCQDIQRAGKSLKKLVHKAYHRIEKRSHKKAAKKHSRKPSKRPRNARR